MALMLKMLHLFDNNKKREYISGADHFLAKFDREFPTRSESQRQEAQKHRNIFNRKQDDFIL